MKEKFVSALGGFGLILWYIVSVIYAFAPLYILRFPFFVDFILIFVITTIPVLGEIVRIGLYIWAFVVAIGQPIDIVSIVFFVCAALYFVTTVVPMLMALLSRK